MVTNFVVFKDESLNHVVVKIDGHEFVMGRAAALCLTKKMQEITNDWAFRYLSGSESVEKVT